MAKMSDELAAAVEAYDRARCRTYWRSYIRLSGEAEEPHYERVRMSDANRQYIAPMIKAAIDAYMSAMRPASETPPDVLYFRFGESGLHTTLRMWGVEAFPGALEYRRA